MKATLVILALAPFVVAAQSVSPVIVECGARCSGSLTVTNEHLAPLVATVTPYDFRPTPDGRGQTATLTATVKLDSNSARVPIKGQHTFFYDVRCAQLPCAVKLEVSILEGHTAQGVAVTVKLPHVVYSCSKQKDCRKSQLQVAGIAVK